MGLATKIVVYYIRENSFRLFSYMEVFALRGIFYDLRGNLDFGLWERWIQDVSVQGHNKRGDIFNS